MSGFDHLLSDEEDVRAGDLAIDMPVFRVETTCGQVFEWFREHREQVAAAVVDADGKVAGIVNRLRFLARYAQPYVPELYSKKPIRNLSNSNPLVVEEHVPLTELSKMITFDWADALRECFVVTRNGRYLGIGTSEALVKGKLQLLIARERQLHIALADAHAANRAKTNFLALMSHELRTPLNAIIGFSEVLSAEIFGAHTVPRYRDYAGDIHGAGKHLLALINDILDLSKFESGNLELHAEPIDLAGLFTECVRMVAERAQSRGVHLGIDAPAELPKLEADRLRVKQIVLNLLSNAVKFTPAGGKVSLRAELTPQGGVCIVVADTGIGMSLEQIPIALEPFRQIGSPMSRTEEGTGLGLALVKSMMEQHGGTIGIESTVNEGTSVRVTFPAARTIWMHRANVA